MNKIQRFSDLLLKKIAASLFLILFGIGIIHAHSNACLVLNSEEPISSWSIVMEDDILTVDSGDPNHLILNIKVFNSSSESIYSNNGCSMSNCKYNLSALPAGQYLAEITWSYGSFKKWIQVQ